MAYGLLQRIFDLLFAYGALKRGDTVVDVFGGVGTTGIEASARGVKAICVELEPRFVDFGRQNAELHRRDWEAMSLPVFQMIQGDSRVLRATLEAAGVLTVNSLVSSPPYVSGGHHPDQTGAWNTNGSGQGGTREQAGYGSEDGQLGQMAAGELDAVVSSPPYVKSDGHPSLGDFVHIDGGDILGHVTHAKRGDDKYGDAVGQLAAMSEGTIQAIVSSPPYAESASGAGGLNTLPAKEGQQGGRSADSPSQQTDQRYGDEPGQIAKLPAGDVHAIVASPLAGGVDAVVSSPPFSQGYKSGGGINVNGYGKDGADKVGSRTYQGTGAEREAGSLETMPLGDVAGIVSSPPWGDQAEGGVKASKWKNPEDFLAAGRGNGASDEARLAQLQRDQNKTYGDSAGQLAKMPMADGVVSSPPYEGSLHASKDGIDWEKAKREASNGGEHQAPGASAAAAYPASAENIWNKTGETFWSEALKVMRESFAILRSGGTAVFVVKSFVRDGRVVDFPGDWRKLCEYVGFETYLEVHAMLVTEEREPDLFDGEVVKTKKRASFFRRLYEAKYPQNAIDFEVVWFLRKP